MTFFIYIVIYSVVQLQFLNFSARVEGKNVGYLQCRLNHFSERRYEQLKILVEYLRDCSEILSTTADTSLFELRPNKFTFLL